MPQKKIYISLIFCSLIWSLGILAPRTLMAKSPQKISPTKVSKSSDSSDLSSQDQLFYNLREVSRKNDVNSSAELARQLEGYEMADYVEYFRIKPKLYDSSGKTNSLTDADLEVEAFLEKYKGTALADRMRNDWLLVLGKRKDWVAFDREYPQFVLDDDTQVKCYSYMSRLAKGESSKAVGAIAKVTLQDPRYFGEACPEAVSMLLGRGGLNRSEALAIARSAAEMNLDSVAKKMAGDDPIADIVRKARSNPSLAYQTMQQIDWRPIQEYKSAAWGVVGQFLAKKQDPSALAAYRNQQALGQSQYLSAESLEWKVRTALRHNDWKLVKESIETMPENIRSRDPGWTYWYGRALKEMNDPKANEYFEKIANQYNFYGQLSLEELGRSLVLPHKTTVTDAEIKAVGKNPAFAKAAKLYAMNLRTEGNREWNWELRNLSDHELLAIAEYGKKIGLLDRAVNTADRTKVEHNFSLRYPTPFEERLLPITQRIHLNINWVYGLIRQESRFVMAAKSNVGASGLMQVMPTTAQYVAKKAGMTNFRPDQLSEIQTNLEIGSQYLAMVLNDLDGSWSLASAAYNAGPGRPKQWRQTLPSTVEGAIYAETIPFNETRTYVKNVLSNAMIYQAISTGKSPSLKERLGSVSPSLAISSNLP